MRFLNVVPFGLISLVGCDWNGSTHPTTAFNGERFPSLQQAHGQFYATPKYGCLVCPPASLDAKKVLEWVDIRVEQWIREKDKWGCGQFSDDYLAAMARSIPIIVYAGWYVPADGSFGVTGWILYGVRIEVSEREGPTPRPWDPIDELSALPHELTHLVLGSFH